MKPFNLEEAKKGKPICTRNGDKARIICTDLIGQESLILAAVFDPKSRIECVIPYTREGKYSGGDVSEFDLMMVEDEEPKCPFKPFDKVLTRHDNEDFWSCDLFSHYDPNDEDEWYYFVSSGGVKNHMCIPYNEETEHLIGTADEAPEKYVIW